MFPHHFSTRRIHASFLLAAAISCVAALPFASASRATQVTQLAIHDIQGNGSESPFVGQVITTSGIVTAVKTNGFFIQSPDSAADSDPNTSEGIFVFTSIAL